MSQRSSKRVKVAHGESFHDQIPSFDTTNVIQAREGTLRRVGNRVKTAPMEHIAEPTAGAWENTTSWMPPDNPEFALDPTGDLYDQAVEGNVMGFEALPGPKVLQKKKRSKVSRRPHMVWKETNRQAYLDEIIRQAGRGDFMGSKDCPDCVSRGSETLGAPEYRCTECFLPNLTCAACCIRRHRQHPFHRIEKWSDNRFMDSTLQSLGLKIQLNHAGMFCTNPVACHTKMRVLHINGIHNVTIQYCGCSHMLPQHTQLLRRRLYPASHINVQTCSTFELLHHLHKLALTTKASTYDFYRYLEKSTNSTGINPPKSRYRALFRMVLQWRHLQMLKWFGRAHDETGVAGTKKGELAVVCPSCPHPGINLPHGWENTPEELRYLYRMILCMDANFRLKNQSGTYQFYD